MHRISRPGKRMTGTRRLLASIDVINNLSLSEPALADTLGTIGWEVVAFWICLFMKATGKWEKFTLSLLLNFTRQVSYGSVDEEEFCLYLGQIKRAGLILQDEETGEYEVTALFAQLCARKRRWESLGLKHPPDTDTYLITVSVATSSR